MAFAWQKSTFNFESHTMNRECVCFFGFRRGFTRAIFKYSTDMLFYKWLEAKNVPFGFCCCFGWNGTTEYTKIVCIQIFVVLKFFFVFTFARHTIEMIINGYTWKNVWKERQKKKNHKYTQQIKTNGLALNDINQSAFQMLLVCIKVFITANKSMDLQSLLHHHRSFNFVFG